MKIEIDILSNPKRFVNEWSKLYDYGMEDVYSSNIDLGLKIIRVSLTCIDGKMEFITSQQKKQE